MEPTLDEQLRQLSINLDNFALRYNMNGRNTAETNIDSLQRIEEGETPSQILMLLPEVYDCSIPMDQFMEEWMIAQQDLHSQTVVEPFDIDRPHCDSLCFVYASDALPTECEQSEKGITSRLAEIYDAIENATMKENSERKKTIHDTSLAQKWQGIQFGPWWMEYRSQMLQPSRIQQAASKEGCNL